MGHDGADFAAGAPAGRGDRGVGRRERHKARTRSTIAAAAMALFVERGFDQVTVAEVADAADVAPSTVFNHFPSKEALVFDEEPGLEAALVAAVHDRPPGTPVLDSLHAHVRGFLDTRLPPTEPGPGSAADPERVPFFAVARSTPALREYARAMWSRHEHTLAQALAVDAGAAPDDPGIRALAHLVMEAHTLVHQADGDPRATVDAAFAVLAHGWDRVGPTSPAPNPAHPRPEGARP